MKFESPAKRTRLESPAKRSQIFDERDADSPTKRVPPLKINLNSNRVFEDNTETTQATSTSATNNKSNSSLIDTQSKLFSSVTCSGKIALYHSM